MTVRHMRRLALAGLLGILVLPAQAWAKHVTSLQPWKAANEYLARADLDGRATPKLEPVAKVNHVRAGQWVRIACQTTGQNAYGSTIWSKVNGLFVPDHYLKTYTDGLIAGVPRCSRPRPRPPKTPSGPTRAELAAAVEAVAFERVNGSNYFIYKRLYPKNGIIWTTNGCSLPKQILEQKDVRLPLGRTARYYSRLFADSCDRHDFGYRNYGSRTQGLKLDPSAGRRRQIDDRLHTNMDSQCKRNFPRKVRDAVQRGACYKASDIFYSMVRRYAGGHFY